eukprot:3530806-Alexandrium_andersonii.AAC.1
MPAARAVGAGATAAEDARARRAGEEANGQDAPHNGKAHSPHACEPGRHLHKKHPREPTARGRP